MSLGVPSGGGGHRISSIDEHQEPCREGLGLRVFARARVEILRFGKFGALDSALPRPICL